MKKGHLFFIVTLFILLVVGCSDRKEYREALERAKATVEHSPDSALSIIDSVLVYEDDLSTGLSMRLHLYRMDAQNKLDSIFHSTSEAEDLVKYFNRKGTANEQMLANYLLARCYSDMGEAPQALQAFYDAIERADTISPDCDINVLTVIYGQMSRIFHQQNLPHDEIWALNHYVHYIEKQGAPKETLIAKGQLMRPYYLLGEEDTVLKITEDTYQGLKKIGEDESAADALVSSIYIYTKRGELEKAGRNLRIFEKESGIVDDKGNTIRGREGYYVTKAFYELATKRYDAAEYHFRKCIQYGYLSDGYKGLLSVYRHKNIVDSITRFSFLYEEAQDSLHNIMQTDAIHRMSSLYNYSRSQKEAEQQAEKARKARQWIMIILVAAVCILLFVSYFYRHYRKKKQEEINTLSKALASAKSEYQNIQEELQKLKNKDYENLIAEKEKKGKELKQTIENLSSVSGLSAALDNLEDFEKSRIVGVFRKKKNFHTNNPSPNKAEWRALEVQFSKNMPTLYKMLAKEKKLSPLELHTSILLLLDFDDSSIVSLTESMPQTVSTAKSRANKKIFNEKGAQTLKAGLLQLIKGE